MPSKPDDEGQAKFMVGQNFYRVIVRLYKHAPLLNAK